MLGKKNFKMLSFLLTFLYTFSILSLSYAIELKNTLRVPTIFKEKHEDKMTKPKHIGKMKGVTVPVATLFRRDGTISSGAMRRHIKRMVSLGLIGDKCEFNFFVNGSSGNLSKNLPEIGAELVNILKETLTELGISDPLTIVGARGRNAERVFVYIKFAYNEGARIFVVPHPKYIVPDWEKEHSEYGRLEEDYVRYIENILELAKKAGMDDIKLILYDISGACEDGAHIPYEAVAQLAKNPQILGIKVSSEDIVAFAKYSQFQKEGQFVVENGFAKLEGAFTGGTVMDENRKEIDIIPAYAGVLIDANIDPANVARKFSWNIRNRTPKGDKEIFDIQRQLGERTHPVFYGDKKGEGYSKLVDGVNLALHFLGIGKIDIDDKEKFPRWFKNRVQRELLISSIPLTRFRIDINSNMSKSEFLEQIAGFIGETREWVTNLPLFGEMTLKQEGKFNDGLYDNMMSAYDKISKSVTKQGKVDTLVSLDRGEIIVTVNYGANKEPLRFSMRRKSQRQIEEAEIIIDKLTTMVRSKTTTRSGV